MKRVAGRHTNIVELKEVIECDARICLIMEYCADGEIFNLLTRQDGVSYYSCCTYSNLTVMIALVRRVSGEAVF